MAHFPLFIDIADRPCLVVGGGRVALRKIRTLLAYEARVRLVSEEICPEITGLLPEEARRTGHVTEEEMAGALLVVAATGDREENRRIADFCHENRILVNVIDDPEACSFFFPAVVRRGNISIGIGSAGMSPGLSGRIRRTIEEAVPDYYGQINDQIGSLRLSLKEEEPDPERRRGILTEALNKASALERPLTEEEIKALIRQEEE